MKKIKEECQAKYGKNKCKNKASMLIPVNGQFYNLCSECAKQTIKQIKANNK